jgi:hypothetical protein
MHAGKHTNIMPGAPFGVEQQSMLKKGSLNVGCGTYSYSLDGPPPKDTSGSAEGTNKVCLPAKQGPMGFDREEAISTLVPQFCGQDLIKNQSFGKKSKLPLIGDFRSQVYPEMTVSLAMTGYKCAEETLQFVGTDHCIQMLGVLIDGCSTDTRTEKMGGTLDDQCVSYSVTNTPQRDWAPGTCSVAITQYDGKDNTFEATIKDSKGQLLGQCKKSPSSKGLASVCEERGHGVLKTPVSMAWWDGGVIQVFYQKTLFKTTESNCKGGSDKYKDGKRSITCDLAC